MATNTDGTRMRPAATPCDLPWRDSGFSPGSIALKLCAGVVMLTLGLLPEYAAAKGKTAHLRPASGELAVPTHSAPAVQADGDHHNSYFGKERVSREASELVDWIVDSADNRSLPFVVLDKVDARIYVFDAGGHIQGAAAALLGSARGDDTVPGIGDREFADMPPETRTTPAGRFVARLGLDSHGVDILWVDYEAAVAIHRVINTKPKERRLQRLASPTPLDNRISYGCINVPKRFYEKVVSPAFTGTYGVVYVLPETRPAREVFGSYDVPERLGLNYAGRTEAQR